MQNPLLKEIYDIDIPIADAISELQGSIAVVEDCIGSVPVMTRIHCEAYIREVQRAVKALEKLSITRRQVYDTVVQHDQSQAYFDTHDYLTNEN